MYGSNVTCNVVKKCCLFLIMLCRMKEMLLPNSSKKKSDFGWNLPKTHLVAYFPNRSQVANTKNFEGVIHFQQCVTSRMG